MKLSDYVTLLRSGMTLDEIKEREASENEKAEDVTEQVEENNPELETESETDYKTLYEESIKQIEEIKNQNQEALNSLKEAQSLNKNQNIKDDTETDEDILKNAVLSFM